MSQGCMDSFFSQVRGIIANGGAPSLGVLAALVDSAESAYRKERAETLDRERRRSPLERDDRGALCTPSQLADRCRELAKTLSKCDTGRVSTEHVEALLTVAIARAAGAYAYGGAAFADAEKAKAEVVAAIRALPRRRGADPAAVSRWQRMVRTHVHHGQGPNGESTWDPNEPWVMSQAALNEALRLMQGEP